MVLSQIKDVYRILEHMKRRPFWQRIGIDVLGVLAIIAAGVTAPIPGPGGLPLLIIGLSLLATNHSWAERILIKVKIHGNTLSEKVFSKHRVARIGVDIAGVILIALAVIILTQATRTVARTSAISLGLLAVVLFLGNRERWQSIKQNFKKHKSNK